MRAGLFPRLAWTGVRKNRRMYLPYLCSCAGMVMMFTILSLLAESPLLAQLRGGENMRVMLDLGRWVAGIFALIFLFYTHSLLLRRRNREFGLYNVLGMGKGKLARVLAWETLFTALIGLGGGMALGTLLSKLAELGLLKLIREETGFAVSIAPPALAKTAAVFAVLFALLYLNGLRQIVRSSPLELMRSERAGERPPRANWAFALAGLALLGGAYGMAVSIQSPLDALQWFFLAVVMVIAATYLLFIAGSVALCRLLQRAKGYYYKKNHFISVSSMAFRMRRNGAGLASICILCTMVLVTLASTVSLYIGVEDLLRNRYPRNIVVSSIDGSARAEEWGEESLDRWRAVIAQAARERGVEMENVLDYRVATDYGDTAGGELNPEVLSTVVMVYPVSYYNLVMGQDVRLEGDEALWSSETVSLGETFRLPGGGTLRVREAPKRYGAGSDVTTSFPNVLYLFAGDFDWAVPASIPPGEGARITWIYGFDTGAPEQTQVELAGALGELLPDGEDGGRDFAVQSAAGARGEFYQDFGALLFLGLTLSALFLFAAVLIIYYKQISEGYEDQRRFAIMRSVGMTKRDIRRSVSSQVLTVFFAPLAAAGVHLAFAFPLVWKLLQLFDLTNLPLTLLVTVCAFLAFGLLYALVYRATSNAYCAIVSAESCCSTD